MVEFHYKNPPQLLPSLRDVLRCERVYREHGLPTVVNAQQMYDEIENDLQELQNANEKVRKFEESLNEEKPTEIKIDFPSNSLNESPDTIGLIESKELSEVEVIENIVDTIPMDSDEKIIEKIVNKPSICEELEPALENGLNCIKNNGHIANAEPEIENSNQMQDSLTDVSKLKANRKRKRNFSKSFGGECDDLIELSEEVFKSKLLNGINGDLSTDIIEDQLAGLDVDIIKRLALVQLQQILKECPELVTKCQHENANKAIKDALKAKPQKITLPSQLLTKDDIAKIAEQFSGNSLSDEFNTTNPAYAGVAYPISPQPQLNGNTYFFANGLENIDNNNERALIIARRLEKPLQESKVRARAVLTPIGDILSGNQWYTNSSLEDSIFMRYRSLVIGSGPGCDLQMKNARNCARLSLHHATIFYDEVCKSRSIFIYCAYIFLFANKTAVSFIGYKSL